MEDRGTKEDIRYAVLSGIILRRSRGLSYTLLAITVVACVGIVCVARLLAAPWFLQMAMGSNALLLAWANRRALMEIRRNRSILGDTRLADERTTVISMMAADWIGLVLAVATSAYVFWSAYAGGAA